MDNVKMMAVEMPRGRLVFGARTRVPATWQLEKTRREFIQSSHVAMKRKTHTDVELTETLDPHVWLLSKKINQSLVTPPPPPPIRILNGFKRRL